MSQIAIDFDALFLARRSDPETSKEAAARVREFAKGQCAQILYVLKDGGPAGAEQIAAVTKIEPYAVRKRLADLQHAKQAEPTDETRKTSSGRRERLWRAV